MIQSNRSSGASQTNARALGRCLKTTRLGLPILLVVGTHCFTPPHMGQERALAQKLESQFMEPSEKESLDARAMVEALANHNQAPKLVGEGHDPIFGTKFDWPENDRVWKAISLLVEHAEDAWPELVRHLDDERYCITLKAWSGFTYNWTVGEMCREIIGRNLAEAYYQDLRPLTMDVHAKLAGPAVARDIKKLKLWCEERSKKKLYQLQMETCEWAIAQLRKPDEFPRVSRLRLRAWIATIEADMESLDQTKAAVSFDGFGPEEEVPYSREKADKTRARQEKIGGGKGVEKVSGTVSDGSSDN